MRIGVFHVDTKTLESGCAYLSGAALVQSVRAVMPGVKVVHLTDDDSKAIDGVDLVIRKPKERMARLRMRHHADVSGDWLFVDTDVLFQRDVRSVFYKPFDVAITVRDWDHLEPARGFSKRMPFNTGVVFSRSPQFWADVYDQLCVMPKAEQSWMGDQMVIGDLAASDAYEIRKLSGRIYNFPPAIGQDDDEGSDALEADAAIVHFKGPQRKPLLLRRLQKELMACA